MLSGQKDGLSDGMLDVGWWILDGGFWMVDGQHATEHRGPRFPVLSSPFQSPRVSPMYAAGRRCIPFGMFLIFL